MKKLITMLSVAVLCVGNVAAQSTDYAHWSVAVKGGLNYYRVKPDEGKSDWSKGKTYINNAGWSLPIIAVEYTVNPYYGFGLEGGWFNYNREGLKGNTVDVMFNNSFNLSNFLAPTRQNFWKKSTFYANGAIGAGFYSKEPQYGKKDNGVSPLVVAGLEYNYNFSPSLALVLEGQYRAYLVDGLGTAPRTNWNNDGFAANIGLRLKFHKGKAHVRDAGVADYYTSLYNTQKTDLTPLEVQLKKLQDEIAALNSKVAGQDNSARVKHLEDEVARLNRELQKLAAAPAPVSGLEAKIRQLEEELKHKPNDKDVVEVAFSEILFKTGSADLANESEYAMSRIVQTLKNNENNKKIRIFGYTDNTGSDATNLKLSQQRADAVKKFLIAKGIKAEHIVESKGMGSANPVADNRTAEGRTQNRRVSFVLE